MTPAEAKRILVGSLVVTTGLAAVADLSGDGGQPSNLPRLRIVIGAGVVGVVLGILADFAPQLAAGLAVLMGATSVFVTGGGAWSALAALVS